MLPLALGEQQLPQFSPLRLKVACQKPAKEIRVARIARGGCKEFPSQISVVPPKLLAVCSQESMHIWSVKKSIGF